jgi:transcriptional regulator of arginine metabolism
VHSQSDLVTLLKKAGYKVTQATASRDLEEIGAVRARNKDGESTYQIRDKLRIMQLLEAFQCHQSTILSVDRSANLAVIHTPPRSGSHSWRVSPSITPDRLESLARLLGTTRLFWYRMKATGGSTFSRKNCSLTHKAKEKRK